MANTTISVPARAGAAIAADEVSGAVFQRIKITYGAEGVASDVSAGTPLPVTLVGGGASGGLTNAELRAAAVPVSGTFWQATQPVSGSVTVSNMVAQGLTDAQLRAAAVPVSGAVTVSNFPATQAVSGTVTANTGLSQPLTDAQLRAAAVPVAVTFPVTQPVSGTVAVNNFPATQAVTGTFWQATQPVSGTVIANTGLAQPLTDAQLRAAAVPVSGTFWQATQPVSAAALPLPTGAATEATLADISGKLPALSGGRIPVELPAGGGGLTDAQLRAAAVPVSSADLATLASAVGQHDSVAANGRAGAVMLVRRRDSDAEPTVADGDLTFINIDEEGRVKVSTKPASYPDITGDITAIQASISTPVAGGTVQGDVSRASNVMAFCTGTFSTVNCTFEGSLEPTGETNWFAIQAIRSNANTIETTTGNLSAQPAYAWEMSVNALARLRVRCTARTSGTQSWRFKLGTYATEPIPGAQASATQPVSGTVTATNTTPTPSNINSAASTNATAVKTSAGTLFSINAFNGGGSAAYVKLYNKASAPTVGTDVPVLVIPVPANSFCQPLTFGTLGHRFALGIGLAITGGMADNDTTAVAASQVKVVTSYV